MAAGKFRFGLWRGACLVAAVALFVVSGCKLWGYYAESRESALLVEQLAEMAVESLPEGESAPITVDFAALCAENSDVVGWLYCEDTPINYPVVQAGDNERYLRRLIDGSRNAAGSLFVDWRNSGDFSDANTVIYGHNMRNDSMFGTLPRYAEPGYYKQHPVIFLLTPAADYRLDILGGFTAADAELYNVPMADYAVADFAAETVRKSDFAADADFDALFDEGDRLLTLSTCSYEYDGARYVLVGVLHRLDTQDAE